MMTEYMYCPACGGEFEEAMQYCPHCAAPLVEKRDLPDVKIIEGELREGEAIVYISGDLSEAGYVTEALRREGLQAQVYSVNTRAAGLTFTPRTLLHVAVPAGQADRALSALRYGLSARPIEPNPSEGLAEKKRRLEAAIEAEEAGLPALEEFFSDIRELRQLAMDAALEFVEGVDLLIGWTVRICLEQELADNLMRAVGEACSLLGEEEPEQAAREMAPGLKSPDAWVRKNFCFALGKLGTDASVSLLVETLLDPSPEVRSEAIDQLYTLEGTSLGYDPDLEPDEQREALAKWRDLASGLEQ